jgi:glycerol-3-phosphate dehydrogenase
VGVDALMANRPELGSLLHPDLPYTRATIIWAVQQEMCMTIEDALSRRTRALLLDAKAAIVAAPVVAQLMAEEMKQGQEWVEQQLAAFNAVAKAYLPL